MAGDPNSVYCYLDMGYDAVMYYKCSDVPNVAMYLWTKPALWSLVECYKSPDCISSMPYSHMFAYYSVYSYPEFVPRLFVDYDRNK